MKIAFNPSTVTALTTPPNNKDITFDLRGRNIFARGVKFCGTNTWRDIKINNVSIGTNTLDLRNGSNTTLTNTNGVVTINSTWRPVVDNLTSDSTTSSLSANLGRVLAGLINSKSDSGHNHDDRYVKKSGDTMSGVLTIDTTNFGALTIKRNDDDNGASIQFRGKSSIYGYIGLNNSTKDKQFLRWNSDTSKTYTILDTSSTYTSNGKGVINGTTITQVDNATNSTNSTNARKLVNWYSARPTSLNTQFGDGSLRIFYATSSTTEGKPAEDSHILHLAWDNTGGWDTQLAVHTRSGKVSTRAQNSGTWQPWKTLAFTTDIPTSLKNPYSLTLKANGTTLAIYDGSSAKEANFTYANVGAASASHTHTYIVAEDLRSKYPGQILDPQRMKLSFLAASTLGIKNDGSYYDVITVRSYIDSTGGSDNALLFSKNSNSLYHTRFAFGSTSSWGSPLLIIDSGNIGSQSVAYASKAGSVAWDSITGKPSSFTPSSHTHSWTSITDKLVAGNEFNIVNAGFNNRMWFNYVPINDRSKTATILDYGFGNGHQGYATVTALGFVKNGSSSSYVLLGDGGHQTISSLSVNYASSAGNADTLDGTHLNGIFTAFGNNAHNITATIGGVTKSFLVNWAADSDKLDGYHENSFLRYRGDTSTDLEATLWSLIGIKLYNNALPDNLTGVYNYGSVISLPGSSSRFEIYASHLSSNGNGLYYRSGWSSDKKSWLKFIDSSNIGSQSVNYANSAGNADKLDGIHANGLLTSVTNTNNGISITVGGTTKSVSNISVNYANSAGSAGSATKVIVNLHTANDTNYPLVWSNLANSSTITENQLYKSWSDLYYNPKNKRLTVGGSVVASSFVKRGGTSLQLLRADGGIATFNWSGQSGLPTWLWGGNNEHSYYVYNPSNFRVAYATSSGNADTLDGVHLSGIFTAFGNNNRNITATIGGVTKEFLVNYASDADTVDGEHAKDFVRAGFYENNNLNSLDTYSFIRSVNSQVSSTSPKGDIGWYNVILLVHRNGDGDGPNYIGLIALGMTSNVNDIFFRCRRTDPWKTIIHSNNYTEFINNYYWANVKISTTSSTTTSPTVSNLTATSSIRMGNIYLQNTNEINSASGIHLNYQNSGNISLCAGGGNVGIGTISPSYKLDVNGNIHSSGTINCNALNVGSTLSIKDSAISCSASDISIESKESGYLLIDSRQVLRYDLNSIDISNKTSFGNRLGLGASSPDPISNISTTDDVTVYIGSLTESSFFEFRPAMDGLLLFLKIGKLHSKTYFWCTARNCEVIKADNFSTYLARNQNKDCFGDGCARIFIYKLITEKWYEFYCG